MRATVRRKAWQDLEKQEEKADVRNEGGTPWSYFDKGKTTARQSRDIRALDMQKRRTGRQRSSRAEEDGKSNALGVSLSRRREKGLPSYSTREGDV